MALDRDMTDFEAGVVYIGFDFIQCSFLFTSSFSFVLHRGYIMNFEF